MKATERHMAIRLWALAAVLSGGAGIVYAVSDYGKQVMGAAAEPLKADLSTLPLVMGEYRGEDIEMSESVEEVLDAEDSIKRYYRGEGDKGFMMYVGYFAHLGEARLHSPKVCYPGAGWEERGEQEFKIQAGGEKAVPVSVVVFHKRGYYQGVVNWYIQWGGPTADADEAKWRELWRVVFGRRGIIKVQLAIGLDQGGEVPMDRLEEVIVRVNAELERLLPGA